MRVESVEYGEGRIYVHGEGETREYTFTPSLIVHPRAYSLVAEDVEGEVVYHPHSVEVRGDLDVLVDAYRLLSSITGAVIFPEPERQFLLSKNITYGVALTDNGVSFVPAPPRNVRDALAQILRTRYTREPGRTFLENVYFAHRVAVDFTRRKGVDVDVRSLAVVFDYNLCATTLSSTGVPLPITRVRVRVPAPFLARTFDPVFGEVRGVDGFGRNVVEFRDGAVAPLVDAVANGLEYEVVKPVCVHGEGLLPRALAGLLTLAEREYSTLSGRGKDIAEIAMATNGEEYKGAVYTVHAVGVVLSSVARTLASTNVLTPVGREAFLTLASLREEPNLYMVFLPDRRVCSPDSRRLEYFLRVLSSLPSELLRSWTFRRA